MPCELATDVVQGHQRGKERSLRVFAKLSVPDVLLILSAAFFTVYVALAVRIFCGF